MKRKGGAAAPASKVANVNKKAIKQPKGIDYHDDSDGTDVEPDDSTVYKSIIDQLKMQVSSMAMDMKKTAGDNKRSHDSNVVRRFVARKQCHSGAMLRCFQ